MLQQLLGNIGRFNAGGLGGSIGNSTSNPGGAAPASGRSTGCSIR